MSRAVSAADANRHFSALLRRVRSGHSFIVTSHGRPVANVLPVTRSDATSVARTALLKRLAAAPVVTIGKWTRDELYDEA